MGRLLFDGADQRLVHILDALDEVRLAEDEFGFEEHISVAGQFVRDEITCITSSGRI